MFVPMHSSLFSKEQELEVSNTTRMMMMMMLKQALMDPLFLQHFAAYFYPLSINASNEMLEMVTKLTFGAK